MANALYLIRRFRAVTVMAVFASAGLLFLIAGCGRDEKPITAESSGLVPEDETAAQPAPPATPAATQPVQPAETLPAAPSNTTSPPAQPPVLNPTDPAAPTQPIAPNQPIGAGTAEVPADATAEQLGRHLQKTSQRINQMLMMMQQGIDQGMQMGMTEAQIDSQIVARARAQVQPLLQQMLAEGDRLMHMAEAKPEERRLGAMSKWSALAALGDLSNTDATESITKLSEEMQADADPQMARFGKWMLFQYKVLRWLGQEKPDPAAVVTLAKEMIQTETQRDEIMLSVLQTTAQSLRDKDFNAEAASIFQMIGEAFKDNAQAELARAGKWTAFHGAGLARLTSDPPDPAAVVAMVEEAIAADPARDGIMLDAFQGVIQDLYRQGYEAEAILLLREVGTAFKDNPNPQLAAAAAGMNSEAAMLELTKLLGAVVANRPGAEQPLIDALKGFMAAPFPQHEELAMAYTVAQRLESLGKIDSARQIYGMIDESLRTNNDPRLKDQFNTALDMAHKRLSLIGQPVQIAGQQVDGSPFDWSKYRGKIVLLDFWAAAYPPTLEDFPDLKVLYQKYQGQGFEIVGINLDDQPTDVQRYFAANSLPWVTIVSSDPNKLGFANPIVEQFGIETVPFLVLVDREGKVIDIHTRGPRLEARLAQLFGGAAAPGTVPPTVPAPNRVPPAPVAPNPTAPVPNPVAPAPAPIPPR